MKKALNPNQVKLCTEVFTEYVRTIYQINEDFKIDAITDIRFVFNYFYGVNAQGKSIVKYQHFRQFLSDLYKEKDFTLAGENTKTKQYYWFDLFT